MIPVIEVKHLHKKFDNFVAVEDVNFTVNQGDVYGFLGPNGAGKSTTIRMMTTLIKPTSGEINFFGKSLTTDRKNILSRIGSIIEKPDFYLYLSARKNLRILGELSKADYSNKKIEELLDLVGLLSRADSKVKTYSYGMKQRLGLAQALLHDPDVIILDEPTNGLDPFGMKEIRDLILYLSKEKGKTIFLSSHILSEVEMIANRMVILNKGKVIVEGVVKDLLNTSAMTVTYDVSSSQKAKESLESTQWKDSFLRSTDTTITLTVKSNDVADITKLFVEKSISVNSVVPVRSLEEYFISLTSEEANVHVR
ncbi:MAG: ABC transporter ATP-binding protein [Candidatus Kapabacteria bacterium]|nr:ABC transporter ATP-binding protein [Candidatus Kapabacteria bacterium]